MKESEKQVSISRVPLNDGLATTHYKKNGAYFDGLRAFIHHGSKGNDNPHDKSTVDYAEWNDGWEEASFYGGYGFYDIHEVANVELRGDASRRPS
jgi:hypothetical protein